MYISVYQHYIQLRICQIKLFLAHLRHDLSHRYLPVTLIRSVLKRRQTGIYVILPFRNVCNALYICMLIISIDQGILGVGLLDTYSLKVSLF